MILVVGATGRLGGRIARALLDRGEKVRVLVREGKIFDDPRAEVVRGDLKDPNSLRKACSGVDAVVTTATAVALGGADTIEAVDRKGYADLIDAAAAEGARQFVYTSVFGASTDNPVPFMRTKGETQEHLKASGMTWTILQPDAFMDTWLPLVMGGALAGGHVTLVGEGRKRHSLVAIDDVVAYAVAGLTREEAKNRVIQVGGAEPVSWRDVIATYERVLGGEIEVRTVPIGQPAHDLPGFIVDLMTSLEFFESPIDMSEASQTFGVKPTSVEDFVRRLVAVS